MFLLPTAVRTNTFRTSNEFWELLPARLQRSLQASRWASRTIISDCYHCRLARPRQLRAVALLLPSTRVARSGLSLSSGNEVREADLGNCGLRGCPSTCELGAHVGGGGRKAPADKLAWAPPTAAASSSLVPVPRATLALAPQRQPRQSAAEPSWARRLQMSAASADWRAWWPLVVLLFCFWPQLVVIVPARICRHIGVAISDELGMTCPWQTPSPGWLQ